MTLKRTMCAILAASMLATGAVATQSVASAESVSSAKTVSVEASGADYGLMDNIQDGVILHCFDWKYKDIMAEIPNIAEAGFTAVQTSPAQRDDSFGVWYMLYQPQSFSISSNALGTKAELQALCDEAEKYGVKVIVDVVANHLRGDGYGTVDSSLDRTTHPEYYHGLGGSTNDGDRYSVTHNDVGMADLNSENTDLQNIILNYTKELQGVGVDGIRWDTAKHISLPSEGCDFWKTVTSQGLYHYGEILNTPGGDNPNGLMNEYTSIISVTDNKYSTAVRDAIVEGRVPDSVGYWEPIAGVKKNKLVFWAESHDTYSNNGEYGEATQFNSQNQMDRTWAIVAAQGQATSLYFSRPAQTEKSKIMAGDKGSTHFTAPEVAEVNKFHNAMNGQKEYYSKGSDAAAVCREQGAVVVKPTGSGSVSVPNGGSTTAPGEYVDQVSGNTFTVTASTISGTVGDSGIAVLYSGVINNKASVSATPSDSSFTTDTLSITLGLKNADSGTYSTSEGDSGSFKDGDKITIGSKTDAKGTSKKITVTLKATGEDGEEVSKTFTYTKSDPSLRTYIYFDNSTYNWSSVYAYVYEGEGTTAKSNAAWPGVQMTKDSATGYYVLDVEDLKNGAVIFSDGTGSATNRYPADMQPGLEIGGSSKLFGANNSWTDYTAPDSDTDSSSDTDTSVDTDSDSDTDTPVKVKVLSGDANQDGKVSLRDASIVLKASANKATLDSKGELAADVNDDRKINSLDAVSIQRYDLGIDSYSIGKTVEK